jgi:hypothetical protein
MCELNHKAILRSRTNFREVDTSDSARADAANKSQQPVQLAAHADSRGSRKQRERPDKCRQCPAELRMTRDVRERSGG